MIRLSLDVELPQLNSLGDPSFTFFSKEALLDPRAIIHALEMRGNDIETSRAC
jgi:hypothetical protein